MYPDPAEYSISSVGDILLATKPAVLPPYTYGGWAIISNASPYQLNVSTTAEQLSIDPYQANIVRFKDYNPTIQMVSAASTMTTGALGSLDYIVKVYWGELGEKEPNDYPQGVQGVSQDLPSTGKVLFSGEPIAIGGSYTDDVLPSLPGIYRTLWVVLYYDGLSTAPSTRVVLTQKSTGQIMLGEQGVVTLAQGEYTTYWFPLFPMGNLEDIELTIYNDTGNAVVTASAWVDVQCAATTEYTIKEQTPAAISYQEKYISKGTGTGQALLQSYTTPHYIQGDAVTDTDVATVTVTLPSPPTKNNLLLAFVCQYLIYAAQQPFDATAFTDAGFTLIDTFGGGTSSDWYIGIYGKIADGTEPTSYIVGATASVSSNDVGGGIYEIESADMPVAGDITFGANGQTYIDTPVYNYNNIVLAAMGFARDNSSGGIASWTLTDPAYTYTEDYTYIKTGISDQYGPSDILMGLAMSELLETMTAAADTTFTYNPVSGTNSPIPGNIIVALHAPYITGYNYIMRLGVQATSTDYATITRSDTGHILAAAYGGQPFTVVDYSPEGLKLPIGSFLELNSVDAADAYCIYYPN